LTSAASLGIPDVDAELEARLRQRLGEVERELTDAVYAEMPFVTVAARHLLEAGGKRFRPLLVLLGAEFGDPDAPGVVAAAQVVELTHVATLYHDDVMDEAALRRGAPSANARWDNSIAILVGDYLFARASIIVATLGPEAVDLQARTFGRLVEGQIRETLGPADGVDPLRHYLAVLVDKTGSLFATSARFGAMCSGASPEVEAALTDFGERIGICFQLVDDIIDVASEAGDLGKTPGTDLREGVPTLPALLALASTDPADARLQELLRADLSDDALLAEALGLLRRHRAIPDARAYVQARADEARAVLAPLPDRPARAALEALCDLVVSRSA
jgi:heptaprenyl diphosphate synthase